MLHMKYHKGDEIKTTMRHLSILIRIAKTQNTDNTNTTDDVEPQEPSFFASGECKMVQLLQKTVRQFHT